MAITPHVDYALDSQLPQEGLMRGVREICRRLLPEWASLSDADVEVTTVTGGISNALYKAAPTGSLEPVLCRLYGLNTDRFINRDHEVATMQLVSQHGFGTEVLGTFTSGRLEAFLPQKCLSPAQLKDSRIAAAIAVALQRFHSILAPGPRTTNTPFKRIHEWLDITEGFTFKDAQKQAEFEAFDLADLRRRVQQVERACAAVGSPTVLAHNDLLAGNVMVSDAFLAAGTVAGESTAASPVSTTSARNDMTFIDFEYVDWAPRGYDWGNHFNEYAGFDGDYTQYPSDEEAGAFLRAYLAAEAGVAPAEISADAVADAVAEANLYALASHQYWGAWCFLQAQWSLLDFDYLEYARVRWAECAARSEAFLAAAAQRFPVQEGA